LLWIRILPALHDGLGARFRGGVRAVDFVIWTIALVAAAWFVSGLLAGPVLMLLWATWLKRRIGGISGDGHGAGIELVESGLMLAILCAGVLP
jgi:adenosylcobinamide-GDP ribazoletransferase